LAILLLFAACGQSDKEVVWLLGQAETAVEQNPDSALHYLYAVQNPEGLRKMRRMHYYLLLLQAKDKAGKDMSDDTIICAAKDYFLKEENFEKATLAAFYEGRVFTERKDTPRALQAFLDAGSMAEHITDAKRKGLIQYNTGWIYYTNYTEYHNAIVHLGKAVGYFQCSGDTAYRMETLKLQGTCFLLSEQPDSALLCQNKALEIAEARNDTANQAVIFHSISGIYWEKGDYPQAKIYAHRARDRGDSATIDAWLNMAYIHQGCHEYDSAAWYIRRIMSFCNPDSVSALSIATAYLTAKIAESKGEYREAMDYMNKYTALMDEMHKKQREQSIAGVREKYELALLEAEKQMLEIRTSRKIFRIALIIVVLCIIIYLLVIVCIRYRKHLVKAKEKNRQLFYRQMALFKNKVLNKTNFWDELYAILNERHGGAMESLKKNLTEKDVTVGEFKICCFAFTSFSDKEIAACLQLSPDTVRSKKNDIRKKLGVSGRHSIKDFMTQKLRDAPDKDAGTPGKIWFFTLPECWLNVGAVKIIYRMISKLHKK
jgi:tetratricopeptide (TPR) repeat protein